MKVTIKDKLYKDIVAYCELNGLEVNGFINDLLKKNFMIEKYGEKPGISKSQVSEPLNEPINESIKPEIDVIKEMEKLLEVEGKRAAREAAKDIVRKLEDDVTVTTEQPKKKHRKLT